MYTQHSSCSHAIIMLGALSGIVSAQQVLQVSTTPFQTWEGFGANFLFIESVNNTYNNLSTSQKSAFSQKMWSGADIIAGRLWDYSDSYTNDPVLHDAIHLGGLKEVAIASTGCYYQDNGGCGYRSPQEHADYWSRMASRYRNNGIPITAVGIKNKSNTTGSGSAWRSDPITLGDYVVSMRSALDGNGLQSVKVIAPEAVEWAPWPSVVDGGKYDFLPGDDTLYLKFISQDTRMQSSLYAFGTQTYGRGVHARMQQMMAAQKKPIWQTIGSPFAEDFSQADHYRQASGPLVAGSILGDMNHGVSLWFYWSTDNLFKLDFSGFSPKWHFMNTIAKATDPGMQMLAVSAPGLIRPDMPFDMANYSPLNAIAGVNTDGSLALAVINLEGITGSLFQVQSSVTGLAPKSVTFKVPQLQDKDGATLQVWRIREKQEAYTTSTVIAQNGSLTLEVSPLELVAIRSAPGLVTGVEPPIDTASVILPVNGKLEAESADVLNGLQIKAGIGLGYSNGGDWAMWKNLRFDGINTNATIRYGTPAEFGGQAIELHLDSSTGPLLGSLTTQGTGGWEAFADGTMQFTNPPSGRHDLYLVMKNTGNPPGDWVADVDYIQFFKDSPSRIGIPQPNMPQVVTGLLMLPKPMYRLNGAIHR